MSTSIGTTFLILTESFELESNKLVILPYISKYSTCVRVKTLDLLYIQLENIESAHIPQTVVNLNLADNKLTSLSDLSHTQLTTLPLFHNQLENIECDHIPHTVVMLDLSSNKLTSLCDQSHKPVIQLYLFYNKLENIDCDHIPHTVVDLELASNKLTPSLCDLSLHTQLTYLY